MLLLGFFSHGVTHSIIFFSVKKKKVQVIQQPYLQQYYNAQGQPQFIMPGNIQLKSAGVNPTLQVTYFNSSIDKREEKNRKK